MTDYIINYTDPLKGSFIIKPYTSNGPRFPITEKRPSTSAVINSPLLLYGKGHPSYGERTDENLLHLAENFSGPSAPIINSAKNTIPGIVWHAEVLFQNFGGSWYRWNGSSWVSITVGGPAALPSSGFNGDYWEDASGDLYRYSDDERGIESWIELEYETVLVDPTGSPIIPPTRELRVNHDGTSWVVVPDLTAVNDLISGLSSVYVNETGDTMTGPLTVEAVVTIDTGSNQFILTDSTDVWTFDATSTFDITHTSGIGISIDPSGVFNLLGYGGSPSTYAIALSSAGDDAIPNKAYVDGVIAGTVSGDKYVEQSGSSFSSGTLTLGTTATHPDPNIVVDGFTANQIPFVAGSPLPAGSPSSIDIGTVGVSDVQSAVEELESQKASLTENETFTGDIDFNGIVVFNSTVDGNDPVTPSQLATKNYVDTQLASTGPYERYIITGTTDTILLPDFPNFSYTSSEYRLMVFKNGIKLYAHDASGSPVVEYGYAEILVTPVPVGSPPGFSPRTVGPGSPIVAVDLTGTSSGANGIQLTTPPLITDVFEFILT